VENRRLLSGNEATAESEELDAYLRYMIQTGKRVAEMQLALASSNEIDDFRPEETTADDIRVWIANIVDCADRVFNRLQQHGRTAREADQALIAKLLQHRDAIRPLLESLLLNDISGYNIRHHGDLHLGQLLIAKDDIFIIDFEGEPRRSLAERRQKAPAARDIAGLLRSIDYSTSAAAERAREVSPDETGQLTSYLETWRNSAVTALLASYDEAMAGSRLWPEDPKARERILHFFLLEKVFYEIEYELAHRPDWLRVPLSGALRVLSSHDEEAVE
jgi:maltose alpha-D-glucosyltransferase/alpha-amylase